MTAYQPDRRYRDRSGRTLVVIDIREGVVTYAIRGLFTGGPLRTSEATFARLTGETDEGRLRLVVSQSRH